MQKKSKKTIIRILMIVFNCIIFSCGSGDSDYPEESYSKFGDQFWVPSQDCDDSKTNVWPSMTFEKVGISGGGEVLKPTVFNIYLSNDACWNDYAPKLRQFHIKIFDGDILQYGDDRCLFDWDVTYNETDAGWDNIVDYNFCPIGGGGYNLLAIDISNISTLQQYCMEREYPSATFEGDRIWPGVYEGFSSSNSFYLTATFRISYMKKNGHRETVDVSLARDKLWFGGEDAQQDDEGFVATITPDDGSIAPSDNISIEFNREPDFDFEPTIEDDGQKLKTQIELAYMDDDGIPVAFDGIWTVEKISYLEYRLSSVDFINYQGKTIKFKLNCNQIYDEDDNLVNEGEAIEREYVISAVDFTSPNPGQRFIYTYYCGTGVYNLESESSPIKCEAVPYDPDYTEKDIQWSLTGNPSNFTYYQNDFSLDDYFGNGRFMYSSSLPPDLDLLGPLEVNAEVKVEVDGEYESRGVGKRIITRYFEPHGKSSWTLSAAQTSFCTKVDFDYVENFYYYYRKLIMDDIGNSWSQTYKGPDDGLADPLFDVVNKAEFDMSMVRFADRESFISYGSDVYSELYDPAAVSEWENSVQQLTGLYLTAPAAIELELGSSPIIVVFSSCVNGVGHYELENFMETCFHEYAHHYDQEYYGGYFKSTDMFGGVDNDLDHLPDDFERSFYIEGLTNDFGRPLPVFNYEAMLTYSDEASVTDDLGYLTHMNLYLSHHYDISDAYIQKWPDISSYLKDRYGSVDSDADGLPDNFENNFYMNDAASEPYYKFNMSKTYTDIDRENDLKHLEYWLAYEVPLPKSEAFVKQSPDGDKEYVLMDIPRPAKDVLNMTQYELAFLRSFGKGDAGLLNGFKYSDKDWYAGGYKYNNQ